MTVLKNITTIILSLLICYTSSGASLALHFCGGELNKIALSEHDANCGMEKFFCSNLSLDHKSAIAKTDTCCKNQFIKNKVSASDLQQVDYSTYYAKVLKSNFQSLTQAPDLFFFFRKNAVDISPHPQLIAVSTETPTYLLLQNFRI